MHYIALVYPTDYYYPLDTRQQIKVLDVHYSVPWVPSPRTYLVATDISSVGRGFQLNWGHQRCGDLSQEMRNHHINFQELMLAREWLDQHTWILNMRACFDIDIVFNSSAQSGQVLSCSCHTTSLQGLPRDLSTR